MTPHQLILAFIYFFVVLVVLPTFCSNKVYSVHYQNDQLRNAEIDKSKREHRVKGVKEYLKHVKLQESLAFHQSKLLTAVDNLIIVISHKPTYEEDLVLSQLVTEIDRNIREEWIYRSALIICNTTPVPYIELEHLSQFYPILHAKNTTNSKLYNDEEAIKRNFVSCVSQGLKFSPGHVTVIRDLVVPYQGFLNVLNQVTIRRLSGGGLLRGEPAHSSTPWLFLHLHEPVPFRHYEFSWNCFREILLVTSSGALLFYALFRWLEGPHQTSVNKITYACYGALYFLTLSLVMGRPYVSELRRMAGELYRVYDPSQPVHFSAITLPSTTLPDLLHQLINLHCSLYAPFHRALDQMMTTLELPGYVISPSLVKYVVRT